jgi:hypothetical protein
MLDLDFADKISAVLASSFATALKGADVAELLSPQDQPAQLERVCRRAARQLLFDLDGRALLDLALKKLSAEHQMKAAGLCEPYPTFSAAA